MPTDKPIVLNQDSLNKNINYYNNANGYVDTKGIETQLKLHYKDFIFFSGYTFQKTKRAYNNLNNTIPLTPNHRLLMTLMYEKEDMIRVGFETAYTGNQMLSNGKTVRDYWTVGFMTEKMWKHFSIYINFENFTDTRLTRWQSLYSGTPVNPQFVEIYAPTDGFVFNAGIKISL